MKMAAEISSEKSDLEIIIPTTLEFEDEKESSRRYKVSVQFSAHSKIDF